MTREEAIKQFQENALSERNEELQLFLIGSIYYDIDMQVCENCKYWHQEYLCLELGQGLKTNKDFGCNKWEAKK